MHTAYNHATSTGNARQSRTHARFTGQDEAALDRIAVIGFGETASMVLPFTATVDPAALRAVTGLTAHGRTNLTGALELAICAFATLPRHILRKVVVISDGEPNVDNNRLNRMVSQCRDEWISVDTIFIGSDPQAEAVLRNIAAATVRGRSFTAHSMAAIREAVTQGQLRRPRTRATALLLDLSGSMSEPQPESGGQTRLQAAIQSCFDTIIFNRVAYGVAA